MGVDRKGGTILIGKDRTLTEQAVLKRKRRNNTARGMEHYRKTNGEPGSKEQYCRAATIELPHDMIRITIFASLYDTYRDTFLTTLEP